MEPVLRTDNYERKNWKPYHLRGAKSEDKDRKWKLGQSAYKMTPQEMKDNLTSFGISHDYIKERFTKEKEKAKKFYALMDEYPNLDVVLDEIVKARLSLLNSDEPWTKDKDYGWGIRDVSAPVLDEEFQKYIANVSFDEDTGDLSYEQLPAFPTDPTEAEQLKQKILENFAYHYNKDPMFSPMTREEAESHGYGWVPSTDEYINALYDTDPAMNFADRELLYRELKRRFEKELNTDTDRQYDRARERYASYPNQFELPNAITKAAVEFIAPFSAGALFDDELSFKTSPTERIVRGVGDVGLGVASFALPLGWGARAGGTALTRGGGLALSKVPQLANLANKTIKIKSPLVKSLATSPRLAKKYGTRRFFSEVPQIFGGVSEGVIGGLADYGIQRGFDQGLMTFYGDGAQSIHQPITAIDLATYGLLGGIFGGANKLGTGRAYDDMKAKINKGDPTKVSKKEVDDYLKLSDEGVNRDNVKNKFGWKAFEGYEQKYPNGVRLVEKPPKPEIYNADIDDTQKLPLLQTGTYDLSEKGMIVEDNILHKVDDVANKKIPIGYIEPTNEFISNYVKQNEEYFGDMLKNHALAYDGERYIDNIGLGDALKLYQNRQNLESGLFDGGSKIVSDKTFKQQKNIASGGSNKGKSATFKQNQDGKDIFYLNILDNKSKVGTSNDGVNFNPATEQQLKDYKQANDKRRERMGMTDFTRDDFEKARKKYSNKYTKIMALPFGIAHGINNVYPFSRTIDGVPEYIYISPINKEKEEEKEEDK